MSKTLSLVRLDFITIKPYLTLKNLIIFIAIGIIMSFSTGSSSVVIGIFVAYGSLYVSFPFAVGEQNGIDTLYSTLSINRRNVVLGRYIFAICVNILSALLGYILSFIAFTILKINFNQVESLTVIATVFFIFSFLQTIQLPMYFKLGYAKAKLLAYLPFAVLPFIGVIFNSFFKDSNIMSVTISIFEQIAANAAISVAVCIIVLIFMLYISYRISLNFYQKRDF